uniref:Trichome birefringence-like N-terminal domain-containing protein n=1 Tax=Oryza rufipogon TaxID=4529 RepID=A0A0E0Q8E6_ORYRU
MAAARPRWLAVVGERGEQRQRLTAVGGRREWRRRPALPLIVLVLAVTDVVSDGSPGSGPLSADVPVSIEEPRAGDVGEECDMFDPLYVGFRCSENGRPDDPYTKWRWRSLRCFH